MATESLGLLGKKAQFTGLTADWQSYFTLLLQTTGIGGMILVSVITAFVFGREYSEGTAKNLLVLPVSRHWFVIAKLAVVLIWFGVMTLSYIAEGIMVCWFLDLPGYGPDIVPSSVGNILLAGFVAWMLVPTVAWIAAIGRGYLAPMGFTIFMLILGNVFGPPAGASGFHGRSCLFLPGSRVPESKP